MQTALLILIGQLISAFTVWLYVRLSPEYPNGKRYRFPYLLLALFALTHLTFPFADLMLFCLSLDALLIAWAFVQRYLKRGENL